VLQKTTSQGAFECPSALGEPLVVRVVSVPLQAADFLAYEAFLEVTRMVKGSQRDQCQSLAQLDMMLGYTGTYKAEDLQQFQRMVDMTKVINEWAISIGLLKRDCEGRL
jgi:hypothetical protein